MINFILWLIMGAVAGWIASLIMGTNRNQSTFMDIIIGIIGAILGGWIFNLFGTAGATGPQGGFNLWSLLVAIVGAVILLAIVKALRRRA